MQELIRMGSRDIRGYKIYTNTTVYYFVPYDTSIIHIKTYGEIIKLYIGRHKFTYSDNLEFVGLLESEKDWNKLDNIVNKSDVLYKPIYDSNLEVSDLTLNHHLSYLSLTVAIGSNEGMLFRFKGSNGTSDILFNCANTLEENVRYYSKRVVVLSEKDLLHFLDNYDMLSVTDKIKLRMVIKSLDLCTL